MRSRFASSKTISRTLSRLTNGFFRRGLLDRLSNINADRRSNSALEVRALEVREVRALEVNRRLQCNTEIARFDCKEVRLALLLKEDQRAGAMQALFRRLEDAFFCLACLMTGERAAGVPDE